MHRLTQQRKHFKMLLVDYSKCTGCRTYEAVCYSHNNPVPLNREKLQVIHLM
ncbi:MAG: hypothetical protein ABDH19_02220 [Thermodesulfovibrio sp.]